MSLQLRYSCYAVSSRCMRIVSNVFGYHLVAEIARFDILLVFLQLPEQSSRFWSMVTVLILEFNGTVKVF